MGASRDCEQVRDLAPELALGIASGDARAGALEHLARCPECTAHLAELASVADEIPLLAPAREPPPGFEGRVLARLERRSRPRFRPLIPAAAALGAALVAAAAIWIGLKEDRELADSYRDTLEVANGEHFDARALTAPSGEAVGHAFGYQGSPSWIMVTVERAAGVEPGRYELELVTQAGDRVALGSLRVASRRGSRGGAIPVDLDQVAEVRLIGPGRGDVLEAEFYSGEG
jgi:Putative zinc-finger